MGGHPVCRELGQEQLAVADNPVESCLCHLVGDLLGGKSSLARRAPDIDPTGIDDQDPDICSAEFLAQGIETQFVVGGDQYRRVFLRLAEAVEARGDLIVVAGKAGSGADGAEPVAAGKCRGRPGYPADRGINKALDKGDNDIAGSFVATRPWRRLRASAGTGGDFRRYLERLRGG